MDSSGSVSPPKDDSTLIEKAFWKIQKQTVRDFIKYSRLTGDTEGDVRIGIVTFGGTGRPVVASPVSGVRAALNTAIDTAFHLKGRSAAGEGLETAAQLLSVSNSDAKLKDPRHETVVLITDGRVSHTDAAAQAAQDLKVSGVRVVVIAVQEKGDAGVQKTDAVFCSIASFPCADNVLRVDRFQDFPDQLTRFLSAICPVGINVDEGAGQDTLQKCPSNVGTEAGTGICDKDVYGGACFSKTDVTQMVQCIAMSQLTSLQCPTNTPAKCKF
jgi:uncharacterized protein YegL